MTCVLTLPFIHPGAICIARLQELLGCPRCCRMFCDVEIQDPATIMAQDDQYEQDPEGSRGDGEEIEGD